MLAYLFLVIAVAFRFLPHPLAFTPVAASLLFFGARRPRTQAWIPVLMLAVSDVLLTKLVYGYPFKPDHFVTWIWYGAMVLLGGLLRQNAKPLRLVAASLAASISFFLVSNLAVWAVWDMYPKTFNGLLTSYIVGLPYFRNQVLGDLLFTSAMFALPALLLTFKEGKAAPDHTSAA
jgi:hypothetical protein